MKLTGNKFYYCVFVLLAAIGSNCLAQNDIDRLSLVDNNAVVVGDNIVCDKGQCKVISMHKYSTYRDMGLKEGDVIKKWNNKKVGQKDDQYFIYKTADGPNGPNDLTAIVDRSGKEMVFHYSKPSNAKDHK
jgi:hypothetical protein